MFGLHRLSCKIHSKQHIIDQRNKLAYGPMLMNKEFNNGYSDSNTIIFMEKKPLFALMKWRERAFNLSLGLEKPF